MMNKTVTAFVVFSTLLMINCTRNRIVNAEESTGCPNVPVEIEFYYGFNNHHVMLYFNDQLYFSALLSSAVLVEGPTAHFTTELPREENTVFIFCRNLSPPSFETYQDSTFIHLEDADKYYFQLELIDSLFTFKLLDKRYW